MNQYVFGMVLYGFYYESAWFQDVFITIDTWFCMIWDDFNMFPHDLAWIYHGLARIWHGLAWFEHVFAWIKHDRACGGMGQQQIVLLIESIMVLWYFSFRVGLRSCVPARGRPGKYESAWFSMKQHVLTWFCADFTMNQHDSSMCYHDSHMILHDLDWF